MWEYVHPWQIAGPYSHCSLEEHLLLLMTVLSTQLSGSLSSFMELLMLNKLQQCEVDGSNYKVSYVKLYGSLSHAAQYSFAVWIFVNWQQR